MKTLFITIVASIISLATFAQSEIAGSWTFQSQESISGKLYSNGSPKSLKISIDGKMITIKKVTAISQDKDGITSESVSTDGKPVEIVSASKRKRMITFQKEGNQFVEHMVVYNATDSTKFERKVTDKWSIANGLLMLDRTDENLMNGETWESQAIYIKQ